MIKSTVKETKKNKLFMNTARSICGTRKTITKFCGYQHIMRKRPSVR